jgi:hypothetical protein
MILTINLAPDISHEPTLRDLAPTLFALAIAISVSYYAPVYYADTIQAEAAEITQKTESRKSELATLQADLKKAKELGAVVSDINSRKAVIHNLAHGRQKVVVLLETLQELQPEKMWLSHIDYQSSRVSIKGWAADHNVISEYVHRLQSTNNKNDFSSVDTKTFTPTFLENTSSPVDSQLANDIRDVKFTEVTFKESATKSPDTDLSMPIQSFDLELTTNLSAQ